jgi:hypothetical protein
MNQLLEQTPTVAIDQKEDTAPRQVFLFSGHMVDAPGRSRARFPPDKESLAAAAIGKLLDELGAGASDAAISSALAVATYSLPNPVCNADCAWKSTCLLCKRNSSKNPSTSPANIGGRSFFGSRSASVPGT